MRPVQGSIRNRGKQHSRRRTSQASLISQPDSDPAQTTTFPGVVWEFRWRCDTRSLDLSYLQYEASVTRLSIQMHLYRNRSVLEGNVVSQRVV